MSKKGIACVAALALSKTILPNHIVFAEGLPVEVWVSKVNASNTGMEKGLEKQNNLQFSADDGSRISNLIAVNENNTYQSMDGFGASITEASSDLYQNVLSAPDKQSLMKAEARQALLLTPIHGRRFMVLKMEPTSCTQWCSQAAGSSRTK